MTPKIRVTIPAWLSITLREEDATAQALFFGDREYPTIKEIFEAAIQNDREDYLKWDILLCASRSTWEAPAQGLTSKTEPTPFAPPHGVVPKNSSCLP